MMIGKKDKICNFKVACANIFIFLIMKEQTEKQLVRTFTRTVTNLNAPPFLSFRKLNFFLPEIIIILLFREGKNAKKFCLLFMCFHLRCALFLTCQARIVWQQNNNGSEPTAHTLISLFECMYFLTLKKMCTNFFNIAEKVSTFALCVLDSGK